MPTSMYTLFPRTGENEHGIWKSWNSRATTAGDSPGRGFQNGHAHSTTQSFDSYRDHSSQKLFAGKPRGQWGEEARVAGALGMDALERDAQPAAGINAALGSAFYTEGLPNTDEVEIAGALEMNAPERDAQPAAGINAALGSAFYTEGVPNTGEAFYEANLTARVKAQLEEARRREETRLHSEEEILQSAIKEARLRAEAETRRKAERLSELTHAIDTVVNKAKSIQQEYQNGFIEAADATSRLVHLESEAKKTEGDVDRIRSSELDDGLRAKKRVLVDRLDVFLQNLEELLQKLEQPKKVRVKAVAEARTKAAEEANNNLQQRREIEQNHHYHQKAGKEARLRAEAEERRKAVEEARRKEAEAAKEREEWRLKIEKERQRKAAKEARFTAEAEERLKAKETYEGHFCHPSFNPSSVPIVVHIDGNSGIWTAVDETKAISVQRNGNRVQLRDQETAFDGVEVEGVVKGQVLHKGTLGGAFTLRKVDEAYMEAMTKAAAESEINMQQRRGIEQNHHQKAGKEARFRAEAADRRKAVEEARTKEAEEAKQREEWRLKTVAAARGEDLISSRSMKANVVLADGERMMCQAVVRRKAVERAHQRAIEKAKVANLAAKEAAKAKADWLAAVKADGGPLATEEERLAAEGKLRFDPELSRMVTYVDMVRLHSAADRFKTWEVYWDSLPTVKADNYGPAFFISIAKGANERLGLDVDHRGRTLEITNVVETGVISKWNRDNPDGQIQRGDYIIDVNGTRGDPKALLDELMRASTLDIIYVRAANVRPRRRPGYL